MPEKRVADGGSRSADATVPISLKPPQSLRPAEDRPAEEGSLGVLPEVGCDEDSGPDYVLEEDYEDGGIGSVLRRTREEHGLELEDVAVTLKIRRVYLEAIEAGRYSALPGRAYALGFIRSYASLLGLSPETMVRQFKSEIADRLAQQALYVPTPAPETRIPGGTILLMSVLLAVSAFGAWYYLSATRQVTEVAGPALPQQLVNLLEPRPAVRTTAPRSDISPGAGDVASPATAVASGASLTGASPINASPTNASPTNGGATAGIQTATIAPGRGNGGAGAAAVPGGPANPAAATGPGTPTPGSARGGAAANGTVPPPSPPSASRVDPHITMADILGTEALRSAIGPAAAAQARVGAESGSPEEEEEDDSGPIVAVPAVKPGTGGTAAEAANGLLTAQTGPDGGTGSDIVSRYNLSAIFGKEHQASRILIRATAETWVQIRGEDGDALFSRILRAGEGYRVPDRPGVSLRLGNAGGVVVAVDGVDLPPLGRKGQVVRGLVLDPARLRQQVSSTARE